jgi:hypothetical protein
MDHLGRPVMIALIVCCCVAVVAAIAMHARRTYAREHRCSNSECGRGGWYRVFAIVRGSSGPRELMRLATPYRVCRACGRDLDPATLEIEPSVRRALSRGLEKKWGERPDWGRTQVELEHVVAAYLRRIGT